MRKMQLSEWESVLPDALHSIRSLLCTATNETPHDRMFNFSRKSTSGKSIPSWVKPGPIYVKNHTRKTKYDAPVSSATLLHANPTYAHVRLSSGVETTVSMQDIARKPDDTVVDENSPTFADLDPSSASQTASPQSPVTEDTPDNISVQNSPQQKELRRSQRVVAPPKRLEDYMVG